LNKINTDINNIQDNTIEIKSNITTTNTYAYNTLNNTNNILSQLNNSSNNSIIKSIQYITYTLPRNTSYGICNITPINVNKAFFICERLRNNCGWNSGRDMHYLCTLYSDHIQIDHDNVPSNDMSSELMLGIWILEFY
jgi:hypothetical protein